MSYSGVIFWNIVPVNCLSVCLSECPSLSFYVLDCIITHRTLFSLLFELHLTVDCTKGSWTIRTVVHYFSKLIGKPIH